jgi:predicted RNA-binding Zn ribbon-like protein
MEDGFQPGGRAPAPEPLALVQEFVNTEIPEWGRDDISTPAELGAWLHRRGLLPDDMTVDPATFVLARSLRDLFRELALHNTLGTTPDAARRAELDRTLAAVPLVPGVAADGRLVVLAGGAGDARAALARLVSVVLDEQASGRWQRLKACGKDSCRWVFFDGSRNRSSSWCSMSICGNRQKTAAYRRRRRSR